MISLAHRGVPFVAPENTIISYSIAQGLKSGIELDVRISRDGVPVCIHDPTLERTTDGTGLVRSHTLQELKRLDAGGWFGDQFSGEHIPTLEEALAIMTEIPIAVEVKCPGTEHLIVEAIEKTHTVRNAFVFDTVDSIDGTKRIKALNPEVRTAVCCLCRADYIGLKESGFEHIDGIWGWVYSGWLTKQQVDEIHSDGLKVYATTVNRKEDFLRLIQCGVDGICTDHPADLLTAVDSTRSTA
jgi:glycerophosphoryl diester phosphodiesterase